MTPPLRSASPEARRPTARARLGASLASAHRPAAPAKPEPELAPSLSRKLAAEIVGTFFLTFVAAGGAMIGSLDPGVTPVARAAAGGLVVMGMIYTIGPISGAHMNPAITLAFALRRTFPARHLLLYWLAELAGALLAAWALCELLGTIERIGAPTAAHGPWLAFPMEIILTALLVSVVLGTATHHSVVGPNAAIAVGGTVALAGFVSGSMGGASMNPARSLAPMLAGAGFHDAWAFALGPLLGALLAVGLAWLLHGPPRDSEREMAEGEDHA